MMNYKVAIFLLILFSSTVVAAPFSHDGIFANASVGLGYASFENADGEKSLTADGFGMNLHGKIGYYVVNGLAFHVNLGYAMYSNYREARYGVPTYVDHDFYVVSSVFVGAGATYYVPVWDNVFLSGALGLTGYRLNCHKYSGNTGLRAFSFDVEIGKNWWVGEYTVVGASFVFDSGEYWSEDDGVFRSSSLMLMFSISLN